MVSIRARAARQDVPECAHLRYGFFLALPATTVTIAIVLWFIPHRLDELAGGGIGRRLRRMMTATLAVTIGLYLYTRTGCINRKRCRSDRAPIACSRCPRSRG